MLNFLVNPHAFRGGNGSLIDKLEKRLKARGVQFHIFKSEQEGGIGKYARSLSAAGQTKFIAVGGDGTLNEMLSNLADPSVCEIGLIPAGTGNDFAAAAGIPKGIKALKFLFEGESSYVDYIECGSGRRSINIVGLGMDVDILTRRLRAHAAGKKMSYYSALRASLKEYRGLKINVTVNGETKEYNTMIAAVCNGSQFGGGIRICPPANIADGKLGLVLVDYPEKHILRELFALLRGKLLNRKIARYIECTEVHIVPETSESVQYDGEIYPTGSLYARVVSGKLRMFRG